MGSLSMLKYWHSGAADVSSAGRSDSTTTPATIATTILRSSTETDEDDSEANNEGSFIDFEFTAPAEDDGGGGGALRAHSNLSLPTSADDFFFKGRPFPLESSSPVFSTSETNSKPQFPTSPLKSATKFRVFMLRSKKAKPSVSELNGCASVAAAATASPKQRQHQQQPEHQSKFFVRFKVEEVPLVSLFTRDNSSRSSSSSSCKGTDPSTDIANTAAAAEEKKFSKEVLQRYLSKIKKLGFSGQFGSVNTVAKPASESQKPHGPKAARRRLGKSRSASAAVAAVRSPRRRDDSLLQQEDGIQSAIAHCKRSFNADKVPEPPLARSNSDPGNGQSEAF